MVSYLAVNQQFPVQIEASELMRVKLSTVNYWLRKIGLVLCLRIDPEFKVSTELELLRFSAYLKRIKDGIN